MLIKSYFYMILHVCGCFILFSDILTKRKCPRDINNNIKTVIKNSLAQISGDFCRLPQIWLDFCKFAHSPQYQEFYPAKAAAANANSKLFQYDFTCL